MSELFDFFEQAISATAPDYYALSYTIKASQKTLSGLELARCDSLLRLSLALLQWSEGNAGNSDIAVLIRQVIRSYKSRLSIPVQLWNAIRTDEAGAGLRVTEAAANDLLQLNADDWSPDWLTQTAEMDDLQLRKYDTSVVGDGLIFAMSKGSFPHYQSLAQKVAVQACFFAPPGSTLLFALPTGGGKSLTIQLPAWYESAGGTIKGGTTIVVVPTISLALDQERRIRQFFPSAVAPEYEPYSWTKGTTPETKAIIRRGILDGTLPVLYVSPEALLKSSLYDVCLEAAKRKTLRRFVIDEVHLVETWGAGFRTEFQLLAAYQKLLLQHSQGQLRTLLLSATISRSCADLLKQLFGGDENYYTICSNCLRAELAYWFRFSQSDHRREQRVLEALQYLPRPLLLYVATPDDTKRWETRLKANGFQRCATFTGETNAEKRQQLIDSWNNDKIDIMVATSAFGVGIDKRNVRTVLHACLPENLDHFYQGVGRAGRDGYSAVSLVCTTIHDHETARERISKARITTEQASRRWEGMRKTALFPFSGVGDILLVDTNAPPDGSPDMRRSNANKEWNEHTLLLMQRAGLLEIMDPREAMAVANVTFDVGDWLQIHLFAPTVTAYPDAPPFQQMLQPVRDKEVSKIQQDLKDTAQLVSEYSSEHISECLASRFSDLYAYCSRACGGCPYCREKGISPYEEPPPLEMDFEPGPASAPFLYGDLSALMGWHAVLNVVWDGIRQIQTLAQYTHVLAELVHVGMQQLLLPSELLGLQGWAQNFIQQLATTRRPIPHVLLSLDDIRNYPQIPLYTIPTVIVYPVDDEDADEFHRFIHQYRQRWREQHVPLVHIVHRSLTLASEPGPFLERIDGTTETITHLSALLTRWQEPLSW
jgi:superfamily II DNA/RNA helicase